MSTLACPRRRDELPTGLIESDKIGGSSAVLCKECRAIVAHTGLLADQIRTETSSEAPLNEKHVLAVQGGGCHLSVSGCIDTGRIDNLAYSRKSGSTLFSIFIGMPLTSTYHCCGK